MDLTGYRQRETIEPRTLWVELMVARPPPAALQRAPTSPPRLLVIVIPIPHPRSSDVFGFSITRLPSARPSITPNPITRGLSVRPHYPSLVVRARNGRVAEKQEAIRQGMNSRQSSPNDLPGRERDPLDDGRFMLCSSHSEEQLMKAIV